MAGFFETLLSYQSPNSIFSDAATTPAIVAISNNNINSLRNNVNQAKNTLSSAQKSYNSLLSSKPSQYLLPLGLNADDYQMYKMEHEGQGHPFIELFKNPVYDTWQNQLNTQQSRINAAQKALQKNQTALQEAIDMQKGQIAAGNDAVNWGLIARNAEEQGLQNAMKAYQFAIGNEAARNATMNNAIGAIGNFGGGGK